MRYLAAAKRKQLDLLCSLCLTTAEYHTVGHHIQRIVEEEKEREEGEAERY